MKAFPAILRQHRLPGLCLAALVAGWLGALLFRTPSPPSTARQKAPFAPAGKTTPSPTRPPLPEALEIFVSGSPADQRLAALRLAGTGTVEEIRGMLERAGALPPGPGSRLAKSVLLRRWLALRPQEALEYARLRVREEFPDLLTARAAQDFEEARAFMLTLKEDPAGHSAWEAVTKAALLRADPANAWDLMRSQSYIPWRAMGTVVLPLVVALVEKDPEAALGKLETFPDAMSGCLRDALARVLMKRDPDRGWTWIVSQTQGSWTAFASNGLGVLSRQDPERVFSLLAKLATDQPKELWIQNLMESWGSPFPGEWSLSDPQRLADALRQSPLRPQEQEDLADKFFWLDPLKGEAFWPMLREKYQAAALRGIFRKRETLHPGTSSAWIESLPPGKMRESAETVWSELSASANNLPEHLAGSPAIYQLTADDPRIGSVRPEDMDLLTAPSGWNPTTRNGQMILTVGRDHPATVAAWLAGTEFSGDIAREAGEFTARWAQDSPTEAAAWVNRLPPGELAETAAKNTARQFQILDPAATAAWMATLPEGPVRKAAQSGVDSLLPEPQD